MTKAVAGFLRVLSFASLTASASVEEFEATVLPFFKTHCLRCHDDQQQKGEFRLDTLARDFGTQQPL